MLQRDKSIVRLCALLCLFISLVFAWKEYFVMDTNDAVEDHFTYGFLLFFGWGVILGLFSLIGDGDSKH